jgi:predicted flap endonuclease-1-like 5' DNA nuclease
MLRGKADMRSDYVLYAVAVICFIITGLTFAFTLTNLERNLSVLTTVILGLLFIGVGFSQRPKPKPQSYEIAVPRPAPAPAPPPPATEPAPVQEVVQQPKPETVETVPEVTPVVAQIKPAMELTTVKGIKGKRAEQLRALGINTVEDLANASSNELAAKLKIASYFTDKWIQNAKELIGKS